MRNSERERERERERVRERVLFDKARFESYEHVNTFYLIIIIIRII